MKRFKQQMNKGHAMIISMLFFLFISVAIIMGIVTPIVRDFSTVRSILYAQESYYLAESGIEDVLYRLRASKSVSPSEVITLGDGQINISITDVSNGLKEVRSEGNIKNRKRALSANIKTTDGVSFNYGIQAGQGGLEMENNAVVYGNVYANGSILGDNGATITGSAFAANSAATTADQSNGVTGTPPSSITFGDAHITQDFAQSFRLLEGGVINKVSFYIKKEGGPANRTVRLMEDANGSPSTTMLASGTLSAAQVTENYGWVEVAFTTTPVLGTTVYYWIVLDGGTSKNNTYTIAANNTYTRGNAKLGQYGSTWSDTNPADLDGYFEVYLGGVTALIDSVVVGENGVGNVHANRVTNTTVAGELHCKTGVGNNKACDTGMPDPPPQVMPISDGSIEVWKQHAEEGGVINGDFTTSSTITTLGPTKITGNLFIGNGHTLIISGAIWVEGKMTVDVNGGIKLSSSFEENSGMIIVDGSVFLSNNTQVAGSGMDNTYVMVLSTSDCPLSPSCNTLPAITVSNNAGPIILNAQKGTIRFANNAGAKEVTANVISLSQNVTITYESGLANLNFISGPGATWAISGWGEVE